ncbi:bifunctional methylenetetrahydrofolate dehydrogenase/methenyltetrahydrofolate cyclohydrolase FolD [Azospirillum brasilense]|uniref:Bifunctional protein FolD n=1 Tax=Azospirillum argentinense TaxID=2970906 RepID=A0A2K1FXH7_9PROT|nr:bifunctional methylenetetrahydrofolate dehydrogenase/methenyltetrahydrofolate cyclohydrolase FolD [Azospirillum argentinense]MBK3801698.1 bifunctional methylenetetrahydrofolate dehydrogenase/methenyltetrahydrofolate cyclohydrolase FolD [Azospirillum argentinense]PNQ97253.1 bifunctional methylenetetrahydrofolate dehydrogenase/methenyltetrahydrofolate cyclohydrolase FolD [Azospirillum argentinense]
MAEARIIDGKAFAAGLRARVAEGVAALKASHGVTPGLAVVLVGEDPASQVYVRSKEKALADLGMNSFDHHMPADLGEAELLALIDRLNADPAVHGILVQLPLPKHIDTARVLARIVPEKDADGFHVVNAGLLATGGAGAIVPCTPLGSLLLLRDTLGNDLKGKRALVLGRSNIVGKPMAQLLLQQDCTVTVAHSRTQDLPGECRRADILVAAVGRPEMVRGDWIKPGAVVIDVGINRIPHPTEPGKTKLVGDVAYDEAVKVAGAITPVPGGVGPMTIACLMLNTLAAACRAAGAPVPAEALA